MSEPIRILYVDDYPLDRELVRDVLQNEAGGFEVTEAASRSDFETALAGGDFDLVLSDFNILGFEGLQVIDAVRKQDAWLPVIIVTGTGSEEVAAEAMKRGAADYVIKTPNHIRRLPLTISAILEKVRLQKERFKVEEALSESQDRLQRSNIELTEAYDATIEGWSRALDLRDKETEGHTQRVIVMTVCLAQKAGMSASEIVHVRRGCLLHDIGKLGVPDRILLKAGPLTDEEWVLMRRHPIYAYELLLPITYLRPALEIPYCHHERWDGTGYPRGLNGEQIPLAARLFSVVDVWDALRSKRPYRDGWPDDRVQEYIRTNSGSQFDPEAVALFFEVLPEINPWRTQDLCC